MTPAAVATAAFAVPAARRARPESDPLPALQTYLESLPHTACGLCLWEGVKFRRMSSAERRGLPPDLVGWERVWPPRRLDFTRRMVVDAEDPAHLSYVDPSGMTAHAWRCFWERVRRDPAFPRCRVVYDACYHPEGNFSSAVALVCDVSTRTFHCVLSTFGARRSLGHTVVARVAHAAGEWPDAFLTGSRYEGLGL